MLVSAVSPVALGETWRLLPTISLSETWTDNVALAPDDFARSDFVTQITPSLRFRGQGARASVEGTVTVPILLYARTGSDNNKAYPLANIAGSVEAIERLFFIEGAVSLDQPYLTPFGPQPEGFTNATSNRYRVATYRFTPLIRTLGPGHVEYELRNDNIWTQPSGAELARNSYVSEWIGRIDSPVAPIGFHADLDAMYVDFEDRSVQRANVVRVGPRYAPDPQVVLGADVGYEDAHFTDRDERNAVYGVRAEWRPSERTKLLAQWEHRFFGSAWLARFDHRTPLTIWNVTATRSLTSYPQQLAVPTLDADVLGLVDQLFASRIPDDAQRRRAAEDYLNERGLPTSLNRPLNLYSDQMLIGQTVSATAGFIGVRNGLFFTVFHASYRPVTGPSTTLPASFPVLADSVQDGANVTWTHSFTPFTSLNLSGSWLRTESRSDLPVTSEQGLARLALLTALSPRTSLFAGARYQRLRTDVLLVPSYRETSIFAGVTHAFH